MTRKTELRDVIHQFLDPLAGNGILLVAGEPPNPMTIGWGTIGPIWGMDIFTVLVRPVRYTFNLMEQATGFSVCVLPETSRKALGICGTRSGRDMNKAEVCGFKMERCHEVDAYYISGSVLHAECRIIHKHRLDPATLDPSIVSRYYPQRDFHMVYYGQITGVYQHVH